jgi:hypothetical protein
VNVTRGRDLASDFVLPTVLFAALGAMTWAVRGCSGFGASAGCLFAGVTWGAAWWFIARDPAARQSRRYSSGWIILALAIGIGFSGDRGWMQWSSFWDGRLQTHTAEGRFVPIPRAYGFLWLFIAGVPWAGLGACLLAWCAPQNRMRIQDWALRLACGVGAACLARMLFDRFPAMFLPLYRGLEAQYADLQANPNLRRLINDNRAAILHLGLYLGFLGYEIGRRDRKNATLILSVGLLNGLGWSLLQNWSWARHVWPQASFNWWRCWESSAGISIGVAYGLAYFLVNRRGSDAERAAPAAPLDHERPDLERFGAYLGLLLGLGLSIRNGLKGWANLYLGNEAYWSRVLWWIFGPLILVGMVAVAIQIRHRPPARGFSSDVFPHAYRLIWMVLITQNVIAQLVTGPWSAWNEVAFSFYYALLFVLSGVIVHHFQRMKGGFPATVPRRPGDADRRVIASR